LILYGIGLVISGGTMIVMGTMGEDASLELNTQIAELEALLEQKEEMCSSEEFEQLAGATFGINPLSPITFYDRD
jgi:hypothetical protein